MQIALARHLANTAENPATLPSASQAKRAMQVPPTCTNPAWKQRQMEESHIAETLMMELMTAEAKNFTRIA